MNLFNLKIANHRGFTLGFLFDSETECRKYYDPIDQALRTTASEFDEDRGLPIGAPLFTAFQIVDSFGNTGTVNIADIGMVWMTDLAKDLNGKQEMAFLEAHAQVRMKKRAGEDEILKQEAQRQSIIPAGGGTFDPSVFKRN
jgi:hypothetical protein